MFGTKGWFPWRNISGFRAHKKGDYHTSEETKRKISEANLIPNPSYSSVHKWLVKRFGKADHCEKCGRNDRLTRYEWSNISRENKRVRLNYKMLCASCHRKKDGTDKFYRFSPIWQRYQERRNHLDVVVCH